MILTEFARCLPSAKTLASRGSAIALEFMTGWSNGFVLLNVTEPFLRGCNSTGTKLITCLLYSPP